MKSEWNLAGEFELDDGSKARLWFREDLNGKVEGAISMARWTGDNTEPEIIFRRFKV